MAQNPLSKDITNKVIRQLSRPENWTKKKWASFGVSLVVALIVGALGIEHGSAQHTGTAKKGASYSATVVKVADGDTATVLDDQGARHKIRFAYIDAPETKQAHGVHSKNALMQLIDHQRVQVLVTDVDRYQREVAVVSVQGVDVNYEQVKNGNAWHYQAYAAKSQDTNQFRRYRQAMEAAQQNRLGLWRDRQPQAPWDYRAQQR